METHYAIAVFEPTDNNQVVRGEVRFTQVEGGKAKIQIFATGLQSSQKYGVHIHEYGNIVNGFTEIGGHYNPYDLHHGGQHENMRHLGDLGNLEVQRLLDCTYLTIEDPQIKIYGTTNNVIGRTIVITDSEDDLGFGGTNESFNNGNSGSPLAMGVIGISGEFGMPLFEKPKDNMEQSIGDIVEYYLKRNSCYQNYSVNDIINLFLREKLLNIQSLEKEVITAYREALIYQQEYLWIKKFTKGKAKVIQYAQVDDYGVEDDIEEGKQESLLNGLQRYRAQDKFHSVDLQEEYKDETMTNTTFSEDASDEIDLNVQSDAWPKEEQSEVKSKVHKIIRHELGTIDKSQIYYRQLTGPDIEELKNLHDEWFPLTYQESFYRRIYKSNVIAIGAFYPITKEVFNQDGSFRKTKKKEVIIGTVMVKVDRDNDNINEIYRAKINDRSWGGYFGQFICRQNVGAYIMTIGVIDECRRDGLGTKLLEHSIMILQEAWPHCEMIYLHVVAYNEAAIKFYQRNEFKTLKKIKNHYQIFNKQYDALIFYKDITIKGDFLEREDKPTLVKEKWSYYDYVLGPANYLKFYFGRV